MSKKIRYYLFIIFAFLFVVFSTYISLYASGYKLNIHSLNTNHILIRTGMLVVDSQPNQAKIYLNNKLQTNSLWNIGKIKPLTTPAKIKNIIPGTYTLLLKKDNYWTIKKRIKIKANQTTFVEDNILFKIDTPNIIATSTSSDFSLNPNNNYIFLNQDQKIIDLKTNEILTLPFKNYSHWQWSKNGNNIIIFNQKIDLDTGEITKIYPNTNVHNWYWDENNNIFYNQTNKYLNKWNIYNKKNTSLLPNNQINTYFPINNSIFIISTLKNNKELKKYNIKENELIYLTSLPKDGTYKFIDQYHHYLNIYDTKNKTLYIFNTKNNIYYRFDNIYNWQWIDNNNLIYTNQFTIYLLNINSNNKKTIARLDNNIKDLIYNKKDNYLIILNNHQIRILDFNNNNITPIFSSPQTILKTTLNTKRNTLYFLLQGKNYNTIYKMLIK